MQSLGHVASDQDFCIADFVAAKNFWRSNRTHLVTMTRVIIERDFHLYRLTILTFINSTRRLVLIA